MTVRSPWSRRGRAIARGAAALLVAVGVSAGGLGPTPAADAPTASGEEAPPPARPRPGYLCHRGGFCGSQGWAYGNYENDTKESTGCGVEEEDSAQWDLGVSQTPILPEFTRANCSFFYGILSCSIPTVVCLN